MDAFLSRKFIFALLLTALGFTLVMVGKVSSEAFLDFAKWVGGIYVVGNVANKVVAK